MIPPFPLKRPQKSAAKRRAIWPPANGASAADPLQSSPWGRKRDGGGMNNYICSSTSSCNWAARPAGCSPEMADEEKIALMARSNISERKAGKSFISFPSQLLVSLNSVNRPGLC